LKRKSGDNISDGNYRKTGESKNVGEEAKGQRQERKNRDEQL